MQDRIVKVSFNKSGGTAKGNAITNRVTIPTKWMKQLGITEYDREVRLSLENDKIIIEKVK
jgi:antitoxin component of MazEF toxin-antitoxin module